MLDLAKDILLNPSRAIERMRARKEALPQAAALYALYLAAAVAFYAWKPADFPPTPDSALSEPQRGLLYWAKVHSWEPLFTAIWVVFTAWFALFLKGGRLAPRLFGAGLLLAAPLILVISGNMGVARWPLAVLGLGLLAAMLPGLRKVEASVWRPLAALFMSVNVVALALLPASAGAVILRQPAAYLSVELLTLFWTLGLVTHGVGRISGLSAARAFCAAVFSVCCQMLVIVFLHKLGLLPSYVLKAMLAA